MIMNASKICSLFLIILCLFSCSKEIDDSIIITQNDENTLLSFNLLQEDNSALADEDNIGVIDQENRSINFVFPFGTNITAIIPAITISEEATVTPASGTAQDFTNPVTYTVTAENGTQAVYTVSVNLPELSEREALLSMYDPDLFVEEERWDLNATDINEWRGVTAVDGKVISLSSEDDYKLNITSDVKNLIHLERFSVFDTRIDGLEELGSVISLKSLDFELASSVNDLQWIGNLINLETLSFYDSGNSAAFQTIDFSNLKKLNRLTIELTSLSSLPESINELTALTSLDLEENSITELPSNLSGLVNLEALDISYNKLTALPANLSDLPNLKSLRLSGNSISDISSITQLTNLESISLNDNSISIIPSDIGNLINLTSLSLSGNMIETIPTEIGSLVNLTALSLSNNSITSIPSQIGSLINLTSFSISGNSITAIPFQLGNLTKLTSLTLSSNSIARVPTQIGNLEELKFLRLNGNMITDGGIPEEVGRLSGLTTLDLRTNLLTTVPMSVCNLRNTGTTVQLDTTVTSCN